MEQQLVQGQIYIIPHFQTVLVALALVSMHGSMVSGIMISKSVFAFLGVTKGQSWARTLHILSVYWGFVFISLHIGLHWNMMLGMVKRIWKKQSIIRSWGVRAAGFLIAGYGIYAFFKREIGSYMFLKIQFVFFDYDEPLFFFLLDYIAIMGLVIYIGHYIGQGLKWTDRKIALFQNSK